jgi:hypothetical protein
MEERRESPKGLSFYSLYRDCPRCFYLKYIQGLRYRFTGKALIFGGATHDALESYYREGFSLEAALDCFFSELRGREKDYEREEDFKKDLEEGPQILTYYDKVWHDHDKKNFEILELEKEHEVKFGPDNRFSLTVRCDRVVRDKELKKVFPIESKTTRYSIPVMFSNTEMSDQPSGYIWALQKVHPEWDVDSCLIDVLYKRGNVIDCQRPGFAVRGKAELLLFEMEILGTILEVSQKVKTLEKIPHPFLFPCNKKSCAKWGCPFDKICRVNLKPGEVPPGYLKDSWKREMEEEMKKIQDFSLEDFIK